MQLLIEIIITRINSQFMVFVISQ